MNTHKIREWCNQSQDPIAREILALCEVHEDYRSIIARAKSLLDVTHIKPFNLPPPPLPVIHTDPDTKAIHLLAAIVQDLSKKLGVTPQQAIHLGYERFKDENVLKEMQPLLSSLAIALSTERR